MYGFSRFSQRKKTSVITQFLTYNDTFMDSSYFRNPAVYRSHTSVLTVTTVISRVSIECLTTSEISTHISSVQTNSQISSSNATNLPCDVLKSMLHVLAVHGSIRGTPAPELQKVTLHSRNIDVFATYAVGHDSCMHNLYTHCPGTESALSTTFFCNCAKSRFAGSSPARRFQNARS